MMMNNIRFPSCQSDIGNFVSGAFQPFQSSLPVESPYTGDNVARVAISDAKDVARAVDAASAAFPAWRALPVRERCKPLFGLRELLISRLESCAELVAYESGKTPAEARAGIERGLEVIEFALSWPNMESGGALDVSRGVSCEYRREPLGVTLGITPFNFPMMVPLWMLPITLTAGNTFILKPSEKVPLSAALLAELMHEAGYPAGVFGVVHGGRETVEHLLDHPEISAVGFVGSTGAARAVYTRAAQHGKRALCLGGAKNHLIVMPDADPSLTVRAVVDSFTGCAGQRCMAGSVLVCVGAAAEAGRFIEPIVARAAELKMGTEMGALIDAAARERLARALARAEEEGARLLLDGRRLKPPAGFERGHWLGPSVIADAKIGMACATEELFGPVLTILQVRTLDEALALERTTPYGNATSVFTQSGAVARYVSERALSGMVGVNVGVPVPRDPFSFGGTRQSKFGHGDITGPQAVDFWTNLKKITTKWALQTDANWMS
ncbi:MAG TPA: CoA-acylating methylmalonate-semialdehyde dehydrogenase [Polyangiaceae bacterium]|nr:CoA-acylating methylmalonate-semialdehyde dehydrogenase [Polyangiaceae bacterium]